MEQITLKQLAQLVYDYCGLNFFSNLSSLKSKTIKRITKLGLSYWEYCGYLKTVPQEWEVLIELLTINETYFFREENQLQELQSLLPQWCNCSKDQPLRIWSAACATGEEPYTLAIQLAESGILPLEHVQIVGTDINKKVIEIARRGWYHKNSLSFRRIFPQILDKYFLFQNEGYQVKDYLKQMVSFQDLNLLEEEKLKELDHFDVIFYRNLLIYFDLETTKRVITNLERALTDGGYLFLGHAESITGMNTKFKTINTPATFYYQKGGN